MGQFAVRITRLIGPEYGGWLLLGGLISLGLIFLPEIIPFIAGIVKSLPFISKESKNSLTETIESTKSWPKRARYLAGASIIIVTITGGILVFYDWRAVDDTLIVIQNRSDNISVLDNDLIPDPLKARVSTAPVSTRNGAVFCGPTGRCFYTPPQDFRGEDSFQYIVEYPSGRYFAAVVTIQVVTPTPTRTPTVTPKPVSVFTETPVIPVNSSTPTPSPTVTTPSQPPTRTATPPAREQTPTPWPTVTTPSQPPPPTATSTPPAREQTSTPSPTSTTRPQTPTATSTPPAREQTSTPSPTLTATPQDPTVTSTPAFIQDEPVLIVTAEEGLFVRQGPDGIKYQSLGILQPGEQVRITGKNVAGTWWRIECPNEIRQTYHTSQCWCWGGGAKVRNIEEVVVMLSPPIG